MTPHVGTKHIQLSPPYTWAATTSNCYRHTRVPRTTPSCHCHKRGHKPHPTGPTKLVGTNHIQLRWPHTWAPSTFNCHRHSRGRQPHPIATATHLVTQSHTAATSTRAGNNHIQLSPSYTWTPTTSNWHHQTRGYQSYPIAMTKHLGTQSHPTSTSTHAVTTHIQLAPPNSCLPITYNCHVNTLGHQTHPTATSTHAGTNHIRLPPSNSWVSITSNSHDHPHGHPTTSKCYRHTRVPRITPSCYIHTRGHQPHPTSTAKHLDTNHFQLPPPYTWAPTTFKCHRHTRGQPTTSNGHRLTPRSANHIQLPTPKGEHYSHPTDIATRAGTNHIQLAPPNSWVPITSNCDGHTRGYQAHSTVTAIHEGGNHIQLLPPHACATDHTQLPLPQTRAQTTSNWHHQTRGYQSHPIAMAPHVGTKHIQLSPPHTWAPTTSNCYRHTLGHPITHSCHIQTRGQQPPPTGTVKLVGTNHIQLP